MLLYLMSGLKINIPVARIALFYKSMEPGFMMDIIDLSTMGNGVLFILSLWCKLPLIVALYVES